MRVRIHLGQFRARKMPSDKFAPDVKAVPRRAAGRDIDAGRRAHTNNLDFRKWAMTVKPCSLLPSI